MNNAARLPMSLKTRQWLFALGILVLVIAGLWLLIVLFTTPDKPDPLAEAKPAPAKAVASLTAPGEALDRKDAWLGQAGQDVAEIKARDVERTRRQDELEKRLAELQTQVAGERDARTKAEQARQADALQAERSAAAAKTFPSVGGLATPPTPVRSTMPIAGMPAGTPPGPDAQPVAPTGPGLIRVSLQPTPATTGAAGTTQPAADKKPVASQNFLPVSFTRAILLGGLDAPTGGQAQNNPQPVILRLESNAFLPNRFRSEVRECFVIGAGYGDISSERAYIRTESLSCVRQDGQAIEVAIKGSIFGEDGKVGMRGRLVSKQGQILANALLAGIASGIGQAFRDSTIVTSVSPLGATQTVEAGKELRAGMASGVGRALDRLAQYYISLAERVFPVIEVDAGRGVDVVLTKGVTIDEIAGAVAGSGAAEPASRVASFYEAGHPDD